MNWWKKNVKDRTRSNLYPKAKTDPLKKHLATTCHYQIEARDQMTQPTPCHKNVSLYYTIITPGRAGKQRKRKYSQVSHCKLQHTSKNNPSAHTKQVSLSSAALKQIPLQAGVCCTNANPFTFYGRILLPTLLCQKPHKAPQHAILHRPSH